VLSDWLRLQSLAAPGVAVAGQLLALEPAWSTLAAPPLDARAEWTLAAGDQSVTAITELAPGLPLSTWPPDVLVAQPARIELPPDLRAGAYTLTLRLVDGEGNDLGDAVEVGAVTVVNAASVSTQPPPTQYEADAAFGPIRLVGYDAALTEEALQLTLVWQTDSAPDASYKYFVHLFDPVTEAIVAQADAFPQGGAHPTSEWLPGEVVSEAVSLPLAGVAAGGYNIAVGWYDPETGARAPAAGSDGAPLPQDRFVLNVAVEIP
ncbi:MAG: hypothetical protein ACE5FI_08570, partial [Anaerolineales bacterium]